MRIGIIATGLIGGSLGLALSKNKNYTVYCYNRREETSKFAKKHKVVSDYFNTIPELVENSDIIVIAAPLGSYEKIINEIAPHLTLDKIITDVGSVKFLPVKQAIKNLPKQFQSNFVPAHPIAGKEKGGIEQADGKLYRSKNTIITPMNNSSAKVKAIKSIWKAAGSKIVIMNPKLHDEIYAHTSHYVQYLSFIISKYFPKSVGDFTRLMNSPRDMWEEIFYFNRINLKKVNSRFIKQIKAEIAKLPVDKPVYPAEIIALTLEKIVPKKYRKYAGSGYKSFTSPITGTNKGNKFTRAEAAEFLQGILNDLKKAKF